LYNMLLPSFTCNQLALT